MDFIEELAVLKYKYIHKGKYSIVQNKQSKTTSQWRHQFLAETMEQ